MSYSFNKTLFSEEISNIDYLSTKYNLFNVMQMFSSTIRLIIIIIILFQNSMSYNKLY